MSYTTTIYPTSDVAPAWTVVGGGSDMFAVLADADDVNTYVEHASETTLRLGFPGAGIPSDAVVTKVAVWVKHAEQTGGANTCAGTIKVGSTTYAHGTPVNCPTAPTTTNSEFAWALNPATGAAWTAAAAAAVVEAGANWTGAHKRYAVHMQITVTWDAPAAPPPMPVATADPRVPIHWILKLTHGATTWTYAEAPIEVGGVHYHGALEVTDPPNQRIDPYTQRASAARAKVRLLAIPDEAGSQISPYPFDLPILNSTSWLAMSCILSIWAEGTAETDRRDRVVGYVDGSPTMDEDGNVTLSLVDLSLRHDFPLPHEEIAEDEFPDAEDGTYGKRVPILLGAYESSPVLITTVGATTTYAVLCDEDTQVGPTAYYKSDNSAYGGVTQDTEDNAYLGKITRLSWATADAVKALYAWGNGEKDDGSGTYGGVAAALVTNPVAQLHLLAARFAAVPAAAIDMPAFALARTTLSTYVGAIKIAEKTSLFEVAEDVGRWCRGAMFFEGAKLTFRVLSLTADSVLSLIENEALLGISDVKTGDKDKLLTKLTLKYSWGWQYNASEGTWAAKFRGMQRLNAENHTEFATNRTLLGGYEQEEEIESYHIHDATTAAAVLQNVAELYEKERITLTAHCSRDAHNVRLYDVVTLGARNLPSSNGLGAVAKKFVVTGITWGTDTDDLELMEC